MGGGSGGSESTEPKSVDPGAFMSVLTPLMKVAGYAISARGGALGPAMVVGADHIDSVYRGRREQMASDVFSRGLPINRSTPVSPGQPGVPSSFPAPLETAAPEESVAPAAEQIIPGRAATPATTREWPGTRTLPEVLQWLGEQANVPASVRAMVQQRALGAKLPTRPDEDRPRSVDEEIALQRQVEQEARHRADVLDTERRRAPIYATALEPGASTAARGAAAAAGMGGIHPPTQAEQLQLEELQRRKDLGAKVADQLEGVAGQSGPETPAPEMPTAPGLAPFATFQPSGEQRKNRMMMVAAGARSGDPRAIAEAQGLLAAPPVSLADVQHYATAAHALRPPEVALSPERVKLIASGAITDPRITQAAAKKMLADDEASAIRVAGAKATATAQGRDAATPAISGDALDLAAEGYLQTRQLPAMGMGGVAQRARILNRAAELAKERGIPLQDVAERQATFKAAQAELSQLQAQRGKVMAFADTADKNLDMALQLSAEVPRTEIPQVNSWLQTGQTRWTGNPALAKFAAATRVGINETAKVTSGQASGVSTDTARKEIESMLNTAQTPEAFQGVVQTLRVDMANRKAGYMRQIDDIRQNMRGLSGAPSGAGAAAPPPTPGARSVRVRDTRTGRTGTANLQPGQALPAGVEEIR